MPPINSSIIETLKKILAKADPTRGATEPVAERVTAEFPQLRSMRDHTTGTISSAFSNGHAQGSKIKLNGGLATTHNAGHLS